MTGTYPVPTPSLEVFANCASCVIGVNGYNGGTATGDAPAALTNETWTMSTGSTSFPVAQQTTFPYNYFFIRDPADTSNEICMVILGGSNTTTWSVIRGINGATSTHAAGATWTQLVAPNTLQNFKQAPGAGTTSVTIGNNSLNEIIVAAYTPYSGEVIAGTSFAIIASGTMGASTSATTVPTLQWTLYSVTSGTPTIGSTFTSTNGVVLSQLLTGSIVTTNCCPPLATTTSSTTAAGGNGSLARIVPGTSFDVNGTIEWVSTTSALANLNFFWTIPAASGSTTQWTQGYTGVNTYKTATSLTATNPLILTCKWGGTAATSNVATCPAPLIFRES
jgi:hypothetical protein